MTKGTPPNLPDADPDLANLSESELSSSQEAVVVPWFFGARKLAVTWITPIYNPLVKKLKGKPSEFSQFQQDIDPLGGIVGSALKGDSQPTTKAFYGTVAGVLCAGPVDELVSLLVNGKTVWPGDKTWADGVVDLPTLRRMRKSNKAHLEFATPHGLRHGQKFIVSGLADASFNEAAATLITDQSDLRIEYANPGAAVAWTDDLGGRLTKIVHYALNDLVRDGSSVWKCILAHDGMPATRPPNGVYWAAYSVPRGGSPNPFPFTVEGYGQGYFYWGTTGQTLDAAGEKILSQNGHPPYRRQVVVVLRDFLFGSQRQSAPNIEMVVRRKPNEAVMGGGYDALDAASQASPLAAVADLACDPVFGLGQAAGIFDGASWQAVGTDLEGDTAKSYISGLMNSGQTFRAFVATAMAYFDGWLRFNSAGVIEAGRFLHNAAPPAFTAATTIDFHDCIEEIAFDSDGFASTANETVVKFEDAQRAFKGASQKYVSGLNRQITGEPRQAVLERPWITREAQALSHASVWGKINAQPKLSGSLVVRAEKATAILQGSLFKLTHDAVGLSVVCRCVNKAMAVPPGGRVTLRFENERGIAPIPYTPTGAGPGGTVLPPAGKVTLYQLLQPPPLLFGTGDFRLSALVARKSSVAHGTRVWFKREDSGVFYALGEQAHFAVQGVLHQNYGAGIGPPAGTVLNIGDMGALAFYSRTNNVAQAAFAVPPYWTFSPGQYVSVVGMDDPSFNTASALATSVDNTSFQYPNPGPNRGVYVANAGHATVLNDPVTGDDDSEQLQLDLNEFTVQADLDKVMETQTLDAIQDDALLLFILSGADPTQFEVLTVKSIRLDVGVYKLKVRLGRFGTVARAFLAGDGAWIIHRNELVAYSQGQFEAYAGSGAAATFRLQSFTLHDEADLSDPDVCPDIGFVFTDPYAPKIEWPLLQYRKPANRPPVGWPPTYTDAFADLPAPNAVVSRFGQFKFTLRGSSPAGQLSVLKLVARWVDGTEILLWGKTFPQSAVQQATVVFVVYGVTPSVHPAYGDPTFYAVLGDWNRRSTEHVMPINLTWITPI